MPITIVTRWTTSDVEASTKAAREAKGIWIRHGAQDVKLGQVFTGSLTGQWLMRVTFADMAAYAKAQAAASADPELQKILAANSKAGAVMHERGILVEVDL